MTAKSTAPATRKMPIVFRICAVCGKRHGVTYGFRNTLARLGIEGDKAVPKCVEKACAKANESKS